jgi:hypothetical protein
MALKGFLASGFQKLIGASRIKGANDQWLGEPNAQTFSSASNQITNTLVFGQNVLNFGGGSTIDISASSMFASTPTFSVIVTIVHVGTTGALRFVTSATSGGLQSPSLELKPYESVTMFYDISGARWYVTSFTDQSPLRQSATITNGQTTIALPAYKTTQILNLQPAANASAAITKITGFTANNIVTLYGSTSGTWDANTNVRLIADTSASPAQDTFILNGDFQFNKYSSITLMYEFRWIELSRNQSNF